MSKEIEAKDLIEQINKGLAELASQKEEHKKEDALTQETIKKLSTEITDLVAKHQDIENKNASLETAIQMFGQGNGQHESKESKQQAEYKELVLDYMRKEAKGASVEKFFSDMSEIEQKALSVGSGENGGYTVPKLLMTEVIKRVFETSPMRTIASVETVSVNQVEYLLDTGEFDAGWVTETESRPETNTSTIKKRTIVLHEQYAMPKATQNMLDDSAWDVGSWIVEKVTDKFSRAENTAFVTGNGVGKPRGFLDYTAATDETYNINTIQQVPLLSASALTTNGLIKLQGALKAPYRNANTRWVMNRRSFAEFLQTVNTDNKFNPIIPEAFSGGMTILGDRVVLFDDMPDVEASALAVAYGDFRRGYKIIDKNTMTLLRDPYTAKPYVLFYMYRRVGGDVIDTDAIKIGKISAS